MPHEIPSSDLPPLDRLQRIMHLLRAPGGCPWDAEQTHESLIRHLLEEAYEVAEAIRSGDRDAIVDELGDLLLQPFFHAEIASETASFDLNDVANAICEKLIRRHPHVFGDAKAATSESVLSQWEAIKADERGASKRVESPTQQGQVKREYLIQKANEGLPALMAADKIQRKAASVGFDWADISPVLAKVREELDEVVEALATGDQEKIGDEIGDLLFAVVNLSRKAGYEAELALHQANRKFVKRLRSVEDDLLERGATLERSTLEEMDASWNRVKRSEEG